MKSLISIIALSCALALPAQAEKPRIIFDTDITGDVDDVLAMAMLHSLTDRGVCDWLGVTISKQNPQTAAFVDAVNTFYGRPDLPVGVTRDEKAQKRDSRYLKLADSPDYPHDIRSNDEVPEAVDLLRKLLAAQPDQSVSIVSVGIASNMAHLLESKGDAHSPLDGPALIRQKVKLLSIMAGAYQSVEDNNHFLEANVINGIGYMQTVAKQWPVEVPVVWSGYEIGVSLPYPRQSIAQDFNYVPHHIVKEAYLLYCGSEHDRPCWDQSSVLHAVFPDRGFFGLSRGGQVTVEQDGFTRFSLPKKGDTAPTRDRFLTLTPEQRARALEAMVHLTAQPPQPSQK